MLCLMRVHSFGNKPLRQLSAHPSTKNSLPLHHYKQPRAVPQKFHKHRLHQLSCAQCSLQDACAKPPKAHFSHPQHPVLSTYVSSAANTCSPGGQAECHPSMLRGGAPRQPLVLHHWTSATGPPPPLVHHQSSSNDPYVNSSHWSSTSSHYESTTCTAATSHPSPATTTTSPSIVLHPWSTT